MSFNLMNQEVTSITLFDYLYYLFFFYSIYSHKAIEMERTLSSSSASTLKMTTGSTDCSNNVATTQPSSIPLSGVVKTTTVSSTQFSSNNNNCHIDYLTKLIRKVDEAKGITIVTSDNFSCDDENDDESTTKNSTNKKLVDSTVVFNKLTICDTIPRDVSNEKQQEQQQQVDTSSSEKLPLEKQQPKQQEIQQNQPITTKFNNMQRMKGIESTLKTTSPNKKNNDDHDSLTTKCDNSVTCVTSLPPHIKILPKTQSLDIDVDDDLSRINNRMSCNVVANSSTAGNSLTQSHSAELKGTIPKLQASNQTRPIYPSLNFSPYASPYSSPRSIRKPLRESRRVSIEQSGSFILLNQYKLMDEIGQVRWNLNKMQNGNFNTTI